MRTMLKSTIHRATVTQADLLYVGSVTVDEDLLDAADRIVEVGGDPAAAAAGVPGQVRGDVAAS